VLQLELVLRVVDGTAEVVTEAAAGGVAVAGGVVDSVAEAVAEHASGGGRTRACSRGCH
jgi:hypothetical protein